MEKDGRMVDNNNVSSTIPSTSPPPTNLPLRKKAGMNTLRWIILFFFRGRTARNKKVATIGLAYDITKSGKKGLFRKILCAIHPLYHLEENNSILKPPPPPTEAINMVVNERKKSPSASFSSDWLSSNRTSRYGSTEDLRGLDTSMDAITSEGMDEEKDNNGGAPYDIDLQAEEFIARFYEQMKLQSMNKTNFDCD